MIKVEQSAGVAVELARVWGGEVLATESERQLLDRFRAAADERAFEAIVRRHGSMVAGVCRSILTSPSDVDDAWQATFLVLVRSAGSIREGDQLSPWLHGVARRVALRAKAHRSRRRGRESGNPAGLAALPDPAVPDPEARELRALIHAELTRLPSGERSAITLCHLEGLTHQEAADRLGWPLGTVKTRVNRGRARLRDRLTRRGVTLSTAALGATLTGDAAASALVSRALIASTTSAALAIQAGGTITAGLVSPSVVNLMRGSARGVIFAPAKLLAGGLVGALTLWTGSALVAQKVSPAPMPPPAPLVALPVVPAPVDASSIRFDRMVIDEAFPGVNQVEVVDVDGDKKPDIVALGGATIAWYQNPTWTKRIIATGGDPIRGQISSSATYDLDGDGKPEVAIAGDFAQDTPARGQLFLASPGATLDDPWTFRKVADVPSIHRIHWADLARDGKPTLIVAPLVGVNGPAPEHDRDGARMVAYQPDLAEPKTGDWAVSDILRRPVIHDFQVVNTESPMVARRTTRLTIATSEGVLSASAPIGRNQQFLHWRIAPKDPISGVELPASRGECRAARIGFVNRKFFTATIDSAVGTELAVWLLPDLSPPTKVVGQDPEAAAKRIIEIARDIGSVFKVPQRRSIRTVVDANLTDAHALWVADVDDDHSHEIFVGDRGKDHRITMYKFAGTTWNRTVLDPTFGADDLKGGDLDGDGGSDVVAAGGQAHQVVLYRLVRAAR